MPSSGPKLVVHAKPIFILGEAMGEAELRLDRGFVGASGIELLRMLSDASVIEFSTEDEDFLRRYWREGKPELIDAIWGLHPEVHRSNVFQAHPPGNRLEYFCGPRETALPGYPPLLKGGQGYVRAEFDHHLERLGDEILAIDPNVIVCLGNAALWALSGTTGVSKLRGTTRLSTHTVSEFKLLPTYHPAAILRQWDNRPVAVLDLAKAGRESAYPEVRRPIREIWIEPSLADIERFFNDHVRGCKLLAVDIETAGNQITNIGFAPSTRLALNVPFFDSRAKGRSYWPTTEDEAAAWELIRTVLSDATIPKLFHNGLYDVAFIWRSVGIAVLGCAEDSMLAHHALLPESLKGLGFLGSIYSEETSWKTNRKVTTIKRGE